MSELKETLYTTKGATKTYHLWEGNMVAGSIDWLPTGKFRSYVDGSPRLHPNLTSALRRIQKEHHDQT